MGEMDGYLRQRYYDKHIQKIKTMKSEIDQTPMEINIRKVLGLSQFGQDFLVLINRISQNARLLDKIYEIMNVRNCSTCITPDSNVYFRSPYIKILRKRCEKINKENIWLRGRLENIRSVVNTHRGRRDQTVKYKKELDTKLNNNVDLMKGICMQNKLYRPKVYFDIMVKNDRSYGRIVFQLHTEVCPILVLEFVRFCATGNCNNIKFPFVYSQLWLEGAMISNPNDWDDVEYDMYAFDYTTQSGILFFALQDFVAFKNGLLTFAVNFRPINIDDCKRFAFGKILNGKNSFLCLQENGTKAGKPKRDIIVTSMGIVD